jgi:hypothetical protein
MFHARITRIGLVIAFAGLAVLGASFFHWTETTRSKGLFYSTNEYDWVVSSASSKPALSRDEIWDLSGSCVKRFYSAEINKWKGKLAAHIATKPPAVNLDSRQTNTTKVPSIDSDAQRTRDAMDRDFKAHMQNLDAIRAVANVYGPYSSEEYNSLEKALDENKLAVDPVWFATRFHLDFLIKQWAADAEGVENKRIVQSDVVKIANKGNVSNLGVSLAISGAKTNDAKMEIAAKHLFGLGAFSNGDAAAIRADCVEVTPMKQVVASTSYGTDIERWPLETPVSFWTGIGLALFGLMLGPVFIWILAPKD